MRPRYGAYLLSVGAGRTVSNLGAVWLIKTCHLGEVLHSLSILLRLLSMGRGEELQHPSWAVRT